MFNRLLLQPVFCRFDFIESGICMYEIRRPWSGFLPLHAGMGEQAFCLRFQIMCGHPAVF